jgi:hypothetical protein
VFRWANGNEARADAATFQKLRGGAPKTFGEALQAVVGDYDGNRLIDISLEDLNASGLLRDELEGRQFERALRLEANGVPPKRSSPPSQALGTRR